jgi:hypothetical protein
MPAAGPLRPSGVARGSGGAPTAVKLPEIAPAEPVPTYAVAPGAIDDDLDDEPALPDEARAKAAAEASSATAPTEAGGGAASVLHVRFGGAPASRLVIAMEAFRQLVRERPGETRVVVHVPGPGGTALPMELRNAVAYDADLLSEVQRRLGEGIVDMRLGGIAG